MVSATARLTFFAFRIWPLKQQSHLSRLNSTLVVKFLHYFLKEFLRLSSREREGDLGTARDFSIYNLDHKVLSILKKSLFLDV